MIETFPLIGYCFILFSIVLWIVQLIWSMFRDVSLLKKRYQLFKLRDELRYAYILSCREQSSNFIFCDKDFTEMQARINNAVNALPVVSRKFIFLFMEGSDIKQLIEKKEASRKQMLAKYASTNIGTTLKTIDNQICVVLFQAFRWNSPVYAVVSHLLRWRQESLRLSHFDVLLEVKPSLIKLSTPIG